jgi:hypothetical protein
MAKDSSTAKEKTLSVRISEATHGVLKTLVGIKGNVSDVARDKMEKGLNLPDFQNAAIELLSNRPDAFTSVLKKYLNAGPPIGRSEYLFLVYLIQQESYCGNKASKAQFTDLLEFQKDLFSLYKSQFPDIHYILSNLNASAQIGINDDVLKALDQLIAVTETYPSGTKMYPDLMARNLVALIEESGSIDEASFVAKASRYNDSLIPLASRAVFKEVSGPIDQFPGYFYTPVSITEEEDWFSLRVMSNSEGFWAMLETKISPALAVPLNYRQFSSLTAKDSLATISEPNKPERFMLHLPGSSRLFLSKSQADSLRNAFERIHARKDFRTHNWVLSLLNGTAE